MERLFNRFAKFVLIIKLLGWAGFGLTLFAVRSVRSMFIKNKSKPQPPLALKVLLESTISKNETSTEFDPYRPEDGNSANIRALRYL